MRYRTINAAASELKAIDPNTAISKNYLRKLVDENQIHYITVGKNRRLIDLDTVFENIIAANSAGRQNG